MIINSIKTTTKNRFLIATISLFITMTPNVKASTIQPNQVTVLLEEMFEQSPDIQAHLFRKQSAEELYQETLWQRYPTPSMRFIKQNDGPATLRFSLDQPLWTGGHITHSIDMEKSRIDIAIADIESKKSDIAIDFINVLGEWISAYQKKKSYLNAQNIYEELADTINKRLISGVSSEVDVLLIDSRKRVLENDILKEENNLIIKSQIISSMLGRMLSVHELVSNGFSNPLEILPNTELLDIKNLNDLILKHPKIVKLEKEIVTRELEYKKEKSSIWPKVSLELRHDQSQINQEMRNKDTAIYLNITSSLSPGLASFDSHKKINSIISEKQSERDAMIQRLMRLYINDYLSYNATLTQIENTVHSIKSAIQVYESYKRQYLSGKKSWIELLNAAQDIIRYEVQLGDFYAVLFTTRWRLEILNSKLLVNF